MRPIGIIISTVFEAAVVRDALADRSERTIHGKLFAEGLLGGRPAVLCLCGIGKTNAAHGATLLIEKFNPALVYNVGVAGAYPSSGLGIGDAAVAEKEVYADEGLDLGNAFLDMKGLGLPLIAVPQPLYNEFPLLLPANVPAEARRGTFATVSACTGTRARGMEIERRYGALCESMEGAAVAHVCLMGEVPAVEMRAVSNIIEDRAAAPLDRRALALAAEKAQQLFLQCVS